MSLYLAANFAISLLTGYVKALTDGTEEAILGFYVL